MIIILNVRPYLVFVLSGGTKTRNTTPPKVPFFFAAVFLDLRRRYFLACLHDDKTVTYCLPRKCECDKYDTSVFAYLTGTTPRPRTGLKRLSG